MILALVVVAAIGQNPPAEVVKSIQQLASHDRLERHAACQALRKVRSLPESAIDPIVSFLKLEVEQAMVLPEPGDPNRDRRIKKIPTIGDEASISAIKANPDRYIGRKFILVGSVDVSDYYGFGFREMGDFYYSFLLAKSPWMGSQVSGQTSCISPDSGAPR